MKLKIENLTYKVGDFLILDRVTAEMSKGDAVGLIGPNGAGKTTLANIISGFLSPSSGRLSLNDHELIGHSPAEIGNLGVSRMFQSQHLAWNLSALENVLVSLDAQSELSWGKTLFWFSHSEKIENTKREQAVEILGRVGLIAQAEVPARELSFGQQRLLALARCLAYPSKLLLLDEPFSGVKSAALKLILGLLKEELQQGRMLLIIDHSLSAIHSIANKIWFMERGRLATFPDFSSLMISKVFTHSYLGYTETREKMPTSGIAHNNSGSSFGKSKLNILTENDESLLINNASQMVAESPKALSNSKVLALRFLSGGYGSRIVVKEVNLELSKGDVFCLIGLNGSGKSTLLRIIAGITQRFDGSISLEGEVINGLRTDERVRKGVRLLPQSHRLFRNLSVTENLLLSSIPVTADSTFGRYLSLFVPVPPRVYSKVIQHVQKEFIGFKDRMTGTFSGGEQAQVALRQLEYGSPRLMLLDEPTSGIDGITKSNLIDLIGLWKKRGLAVLVVEHDLDFVCSVATHIAVLKNGNLTRLPSVESLKPEMLLEALAEATANAKE